jgi:SAM-dependent methyltransferase
MYQDGRVYDQLFSSNDDLVFWRGLAQASGGSVLELACGTGRIAAALAADGHRVVGLDIATPMLAEARRKSDSVEWIAADMRSFTLSRRFDLVILAANAFCHLLTLRDCEDCLRSVLAHLEGGGRFALDVPVPVLAGQGVRFHLGAYDAADGNERVTVDYSYRYAPDTQLVTTRMFHQLSTGREIVTDVVARAYFPCELDTLLSYNGLRVEAKFGGYDRAALNARSLQQLIVCSRSS